MRRCSAPTTRTRARSGCRRGRSPPARRGCRRCPKADHRAHRGTLAHALQAAAVTRDNALISPHLWHATSEAKCERARVEGLSRGGVTDTRTRTTAADAARRALRRTYGGARPQRRVDVTISGAFALNPASGPPAGWAAAVEIGDRLARPGDVVELAPALRFGDQALGDDLGDVHAATLSAAPTRMATASAASTTAAPKRRPGRRVNRSTGPLTLTAATTNPT